MYFGNIQELKSDGGSRKQRRGGSLERRSVTGRYRNGKRLTPKVSFICGGGSGYEPAHAFFVGKALLTAALSGSVYASPSGNSTEDSVEYPGYVQPASVPQAIRNLASPSKTAFRRGTSKPETLVELKLQPDDSFVHPIPGSRTMYRQSNATKEKRDRNA
ncbi:hypothetical protein GG344DRAFT_84464 [Lentinula edodes]|nr:hypothetical protein GG344DRAFT_84464 [Lentinula edodes]